MNFARLLPVVLSSLLLAAHFLRAGAWGPMTACLLWLPLLLVRRRWVALVTMVLLLAAAGVWVETVVALAGLRQQMGGTWLRLVLILGGVATFTAASGLVFFTRGLRNRYPAGGPKERWIAGAFLTTCLVGGLVLHLLPPSILLVSGDGGLGWLFVLAAACLAALIVGQQWVSATQIEAHPKGD